MEIVATTSLPAVDRPNTDRWNAARSCQVSIIQSQGCSILCDAFRLWWGLWIERSQRTIQLLLPWIMCKEDSQKPTNFELDNETIVEKTIPYDHKIEFNMESLYI